jgi:HAD superfamily hydrolase (TIGR01484 family)
MADGIDPATQKIAAVLADVDGTLVTKNKALTPRAIRAVKTLQERGVLFAVTSGRPPRGMRMLVEPLGMKVPMAAFNGGIIILPDMTVVDERAIPADITPTVIETIRAHGLYVWIYRATDLYITDPDAPHAKREA